MSINSDFVLDDPHMLDNDESALYVRSNKVIQYVYHVDASIQDALGERSKLPSSMTTESVVGDDRPPLERLLGFSGCCFRHLMNNLCSIEGANYLEVGVYKGSTLISSVYGNEDTLGEVHAIDNYSQFVSDDPKYMSPKDEFKKNLDLFLPNTQNKIKFHETDCFEFDIAQLPKIDIYFYDGDHSEEAQYQAFKYFEPAFSDVFITVIDDWVQGQVRRGTRRAYEEIGYDVVASRAVIPGKGHGLNRVNNPCPKWWCGTHVAVLQKRKTT